MDFLSITLWTKYTGAAETASVSSSEEPTEEHDISRRDRDGAASLCGQVWVLAGREKVDIKVYRRSKKRGMTSYRGGASPLLKLRPWKLKGGWKAYWQSWKDETARYAA